MGPSPMRRTTLPWLTAVVLVHLLAWYLVHRGAQVERRLRLLTSRSACEAKVKVAGADSRLDQPGGPWTGLRIGVKSTTLAAGISPRVRVHGVLAGGRPAALSRARVPRRDPFWGDLARRLWCELRGRPQPNPSVTEDSLEVRFPASFDVDVDATLYNLGEVRIALLDVAGHETATLGVTPEGAMGWSRDGADRASLDMATIQQVPRTVYEGPRTLERLQVQMIAADIWLARWARRALLLIALAAVVALVRYGLRRLRSRDTPPEGEAAERSDTGAWRLPAVVPTSVAALLVAAAFTGSAWIAWDRFEGRPHVQDETAYVVAARSLAHGRLGFPLPPGSGDALTFPPFLRNTADVLFPYWPGTFQLLYPLVLALPSRLDLEWLVNPVLGALLTALLYVFARRSFGTVTALLATFLFVVSPFSRVSSASLMSTTLVGLLVNLTFLSIAQALLQGSARWSAAAGFCLGLVVNCRSYDGLLTAGGAALTLHGALFVLPARQVRRLLGFAVLGGLPMLIAFLWQAKVLGFFGGAVKSGGILGVFSGFLWGDFERVVSFDLLLLGWPAAAAPGLLLLGLALLPTTRPQAFVAMLALLFPLGYTIFAWHGVMFGPRYWYPSLPAMCLVMALCVHRLYEVVRIAVQKTWPARWAVRGAVPALAGLLGVAPMLGSYWPSTANAYSGNTFKRGFNGFDSTFLTLPERYGVSNAVIFVGANLPWQVLCSGIGENTRQALKGPIVYAADIRRNYQALRAAYPDRGTYLLVEEEGDPTLYEVKSDARGDLAFSKLPEPSVPPRMWRFRDAVGKENVYQGLAPGLFQTPMLGGLACGPDGSLYSTFSYAHRAFRWDAKGVLRTVIGAGFLEHPGGLHIPRGVGIDAAGNVHVADIGSFAVVRFRSDGGFLQRCVKGIGGRPLGRPMGLAVLPDGATLVAEAGQPRLTLIDAAGAPSGFCPEATFDQPVSLSRDSAGYVYVLDRGPKQVVQLSADCRRVKAIPLKLGDEYVSEAGYFTATDGRTLYVNEFDRSSLLVVDIPSGTSRRVGSPVLTPKPMGLALDGGNLKLLSAYEMRVLTLSAAELRSSAASAP